MKCTWNINNSFTQWLIYNNITKPGASPHSPSQNYVISICLWMFELIISVPDLILSFLLHHPFITYVHFQPFLSGQRAWSYMF